MLLFSLAIVESDGRSGAPDDAGHRQGSPHQPSEKRRGGLCLIALRSVRLRCRASAHSPILLDAELNKGCMKSTTYLRSQALKSVGDFM